MMKKRVTEIVIVSVCTFFSILAKIIDKFSNKYDAHWQKIIYFKNTT